MRKILMILMVFLVFGCAKKYVKESPEEPVKEEAVKEEVRVPEKPEKEVVKEDIYAGKEGKIKDGEIGIGDKDKKDVLTAEEKAILKDILFDYDKYDIRPDARPVLDGIASWMNKNSNINIITEGHCDERGTNEYNLALGEKRAKAARDYLVSLGVSTLRITIVTYGEEKPLCTEQNEDCWQRNRRAHFVVTK